MQLRRTVDRANRANVSIYAADMRGLQAIVAGGDATHGQHARTSRRSPAPRRAISSIAWRRQQDTLTTIAEDTGGRAFFDSNSFGAVFDRVVNDTSAYYVLGYSSTNAGPRRPLPPHQGAAEADRTSSSNIDPATMRRATSRTRRRTTASSSCRISCCPICRPPI